MKIVHIGPDSQFIQFLSGVFEEVAPGASTYLVTSTSPRAELQFPIRTGTVRILERGLRGAMLIPMLVRGCDLVIVHGMSPYGMVAFCLGSSNMARVWSGWGFDYYGDDLDPAAGLVTDATRSLVGDGFRAESFWSSVTILKSRVSQYLQHCVAKRTDYFSAPIPSDLSVFKQRFSGFSGEYAQLNYGSVAETFAQGTLAGSAVNILVGNSALPTNNHVDVFHMLAQYDLSARQVIVPLAYGDPAYRKNLIIRGREVLGKAFVPLVDFLSFEKYRLIVASCNLVIMNHRRQQALGNIGAALYQGSHVYLNGMSPVYKFFKEQGAFLHSVEELASSSLPEGGLHLHDVTHNRVVLERFWGSEQIRANVKALLARVASA